MKKVLCNTGFLTVITETLCLIANANASSTATVYIGRYFEVRDHEQPTKYVFNGPTRVASVVGSLSNNSRLQRIRLFTGWNLCSLAVNGALAPAPGQSLGSIVSTVLKWEPGNREWLAAAPEDTFQPGSVIWIQARTNSIVTVAGAYADPTPQQIEPGGYYLASAGLEATSPVFAPDLSAWLYEPLSNQWEEELPGDLAGLSNLPSTLAPGEALFVNAGVTSSVQPPDPAARIRYYHQDHLGSSSLVTDADGALMEGTIYFPFGVPRYQYQLQRVAQQPYEFTQKERDRETGCFYFEARFLSGGLARFLTPDPKYSNPERLTGGEFAPFLADPQQNNLYDYVRNNPLSSTDPTGLGGDPGSGHDPESEEQLEKNEKYAQGGEAGIFATDLAENLASHGSTLSDLAGGLSIALNVGVAGLKTLEFVYHPTAKNAVSLGWHTTKAVGTYFAPEIFLPIQGGELALRKMSDYTDEKVASFNAAARSLEKSAKELNRISSELEGQAKELQAYRQKLERETALLNAETTRLKYLKQQEDAADSKQFKEFWHQRQIDTIEYYHKYFGL